MYIFEQLSAFFQGRVQRDGASLFFPRQAYMLGQKGAVWVNVAEPFELYERVPQLKSVIDRKANMFANMKLIVVDKDGKEVDNSMTAKLYSLLDKPNPLNSQNAFLKQFKIQEQVYGHQFIYKNQPSKLGLPVTLFNLSARYMQPWLTGKFFNQTDVSGIIDHYQFQTQGKIERFESEDIMFSRLADIDSPIMGRSPIISLKMPLSNIIAAYEYRNVIMNEKGAIGMITNEQKDVNGTVPLTREQKKENERLYRGDYGIKDHQMKTMFFDFPAKYTPMAYPTKDMLLMEEVDNNTLAIVDAYGLSANIFAVKDATYENLKQGLIHSYQDTIIPEADEFALNLTSFLQVEKFIGKGCRIVAKYNHLQILQEDEGQRSDALQKKVAAVAQAVQSGIISPQQAAAFTANDFNITI